MRVESEGRHPLARRESHASVRVEAKRRKQQAAARLGRARACVCKGRSGDMPAADVAWIDRSREHGSATCCRAQLARRLSAAEVEAVAAPGKLLVSTTPPRAGSTSRKLERIDAPKRKFLPRRRRERGSVRSALVSLASVPPEKRKSSQGEHRREHRRGSAVHPRPPARAGSRRLLVEFRVPGALLARRVGRERGDGRMAHALMAVWRSVEMGACESRDFRGERERSTLPLPRASSQHICIVPVSPPS